MKRQVNTDYSWKQLTHIGLLFVMMMILSSIALTQSGGIIVPGSSHNNAAIYGRIWGPDNVPAVGAHILVTNQEMSTLHGDGVSDLDPGSEDGGYQITNLPINKELWIFVFHEKLPGLVASKEITLNNNEYRKVNLTIELDFNDPGFISNPIIRLLTLIEQSQEFSFAESITKQLKPFIGKAPLEPILLEIYVADVDGNSYKTVKIGNQVWMAENLKVTHYQNGDPITTGYRDYKWKVSSTGAFAVYPYDNDYGNVESCGGDCAEVYGNLYNWYAVDDSRNIAPAGWHIPTDEEWMELVMYLGMSYEEAHTLCLYRGTDEGSQLAGNADLWEFGILKYNGEFGTSGFNALPGGCRGDHFGGFGSLGNGGSFWSSTAYNRDEAWLQHLDHSESKVIQYHIGKRFGFSVRCVRD